MASKVIRTVAAILTALAGVSAMIGCGGSGTTTETTETTEITVTVRPGTAFVRVGRTQQFTAVVTRQAEADVTWSVDGGEVNGAISDTGLYTAPDTVPDPPNVTVRATSQEDPEVSGTARVTVLPAPGGTPDLTNLFFLHHSTGDNLIVQGNVRQHVADYNAANGTAFTFWDHGYNGDGLRDADGNATGTNYDIPNDNTDPDGLHYLWTSAAADAVHARNEIMANHEVIAFKSCFPASGITDEDMLNQYKSWYRDMRDYFDDHPEKLFVVMSTPPLHRLATNAGDAGRARSFANWLKSAEYLAGHPNVVCFDLFDQWAHPNDGSARANRLRYEYEGDHGRDDSHPNQTANEAVGPVFVQFLCEAARAY